MAKNLSAFVLGGTGGAGSAIIKALAREPRFEKVLLVSRRQIEFPNSDETSDYSKFEQKILPDFDKILEAEIAEIFKGLDVGFYALGVSVTKVDEVTYRKIEHGYSTAVGRYAKEGGCQHFHWLSGNSGGMAGSGVVKTLRFLDRCNKISIEAEMLGQVIVTSTFRESENPNETFHNAEIVQMGRELTGKTKCC